MDSEDWKLFVLNELFPAMHEDLELFAAQLLEIQSLPLVLTNEDLKRLFQVSDSTLNRLIKLTDFPSCWYGIRGHYLRDDVLEWLKIHDYDGYIEQISLLRSL